MQGSVVRRLVVSVKAEVTQGRGAADALARPVLAPCALWRGMGMPGRVWARRFLLAAVKIFFEAVLGRAQVSEGEVDDKVMQAGLDQKRRWHEVACHATAWHGLGCLIQTKSSASGEVDVVK
jgi:hypothetical protein